MQREPQELRVQREPQELRVQREPLELRARQEAVEWRLPQLLRRRQRREPTAVAATWPARRSRRRLAHRRRLPKRPHSQHPQQSQGSRQRRSAPAPPLPLISRKRPSLSLPRPAHRRRRRPRPALDPRQPSRPERSPRLRQWHQLRPPPAPRLPPDHPSTAHQEQLRLVEAPSFLARRSPAAWPAPTWRSRPCRRPRPSSAVRRRCSRSAWRRSHPGCARYRRPSARVQSPRRHSWSPSRPARAS